MSHTSLDLPSVPSEVRSHAEASVKEIPVGKDAGEFMELKFEAGSWVESGIPEEGCWMRGSAFDKLLEQSGAYTADDLILGLMDWLDVTDEPEAALQTLRRMLNRHYPAEGRNTARCRYQDEHGVDRIFHVGRIDLESPLTAWQRRDWLMAVAQPSQERGRMIVCAPAPLSLNTATRILSLSMVNYMGEPFDSFEGARTRAASIAAFYLWESGAVTPTRYDGGLPAEMRGRMDQAAASWLAPSQLARQVAIAAFL